MDRVCVFCAKNKSVRQLEMCNAQGKLWERGNCRDFCLLGLIRSRNGGKSKVSLEKLQKFISFCSVYRIVVIFK